MKVIVTNATKNSGLAVIRALANRGVEIIGADDRALPFNAHSRYTRPYLLYSKTEKDDFLSSIIEILKRERPDVLIPVLSTIGTAKLSQNKKEIEKFTQILIPNYNSFIIVQDSKSAVEKCQEMGIESPRLLTEGEAITELNKNANKNSQVKIVIKPRFEIGGSQGLSIVQDVESFKRAKSECERIFGETVIQEYIPGPSESMRTVNLLFDKKSELASYFTTKKIRQWPITGGISALTISTDEWDLVDMLLSFFENLNWQGPVEIELKIDKRDNRPKLIEINPRYWGYIGFPIKCGVNFPLHAYNLSKGKKAGYGENQKYDVGIKYINFSAYLKVIASDLIYNKNIGSSVSKILYELKGKKVTNNMELKDSLVIIAKILFELKSEFLKIKFNSEKLKIYES